MNRETIFSFGDNVLLRDKKGNKYLLVLEEGKKFHVHTGFINHNDIAGSVDGSLFETTQGDSYRGFSPTYSDFTMNIKRKAQIIYPKDAAAMTMWSDIAPGMKVFEAGIGQGALSISILRAIGNSGHLTTYELREDFIKQSKKFINQFLGKNMNLKKIHTVEQRSAYDEIEGEYDRVLLDLPEPWQVLPHLEKALISGGIITVYLPSIIQVSQYVECLKKLEIYEDIETFELLLRPWKVDGRAVRPEIWIFNHSAFLVKARKVI